MHEVDWQGWQPQERATLIFVVEGQRLLLIRKLRGLGAGKITGPGGRLEIGESASACACRELKEELGLVTTSPEWRGELHFQFTSGYSLAVDVFLTTEYEGQPRPSDEAIPHWFDFAAIPYDEMWADDILWIPLMLAGTRFRGRFLFADEQMLTHEIESDEEPSNGLKSV